VDRAVTAPPATPDERYAALGAVLLGQPGVSQGGRGFGSTALRVHGRIFVMLTDGRLVLKLPARRVDELIASGDGQRFDPGHGRLMKEWLSLEPASGAEWLALAREAMAFVGSRG
jgi:hypothetical protein